MHPPYFLQNVNLGKQKGNRGFYMLQLKEIKKDYKTAGLTVQALKGVDLRFRKN